MFVLRDRRDERKALDDLLGAVRSGQSRALVICGEAGIGKTALLDYLVGQADDCRVVRVTGVQPEMELAYAALHQLCVPLLDRIERIAEPQRDALRTAFGLEAGSPPDRFLVGLAVLSLLAEASVERPLLCVVDDAQWLDSSSVEAITFAARRLEVESVAIVFGVREPHTGVVFDRLPELALTGLPNSDAREILTSGLHSPVDSRVVDRVVMESRGNPLVLLEFPRVLDAADSTGGFAPSAGSLPRQLEVAYERTLKGLPVTTQLLLLVAAADPLGDPVVVRRAADRLGIGADAATAAAESGLLEIDSRVRFRHPLLRAAIYRAASADNRRKVHHVLAEVTDENTDPERRAWHCAQAVDGPDEELAALLERSAGRAQARGGFAAAAAFLETSTGLTPDPTRRAERAIAAAQARHQAGGHDAALKYVAIAEAGKLDELTHAKTYALRARIAFALNRGAESPRLLLKAGEQFEPLDATLARETYLDALLAATFAGSLAAGAEAHDIAEAVRLGPQQGRRDRPADQLLDGLAKRFTEGYAAGAPGLRRALEAFRGPAVSEADEIRWLRLACTTAAHLWDNDMWAALCARKVQLTRDVGALAALPLALDSNANMEVTFGRLMTAEGLLEELHAVSAATGVHPLPVGALALAAWRGSEAQTADLAERTIREALDRGEGVALAAAKHAQAVLLNSMSRYDEALTAASQAQERSAELSIAPGAALAELAEAAARIGNAERAAQAVESLSEWTRVAGTDWALGIEARSRALISDDTTADHLYLEAIDRLTRSGVQGECARAHLLYGEWLRRRNRRADARSELRVAREMFDAMSMSAFAGRATAELRATGEAVRTRSASHTSKLTPQESQIARLAGEGLSNAEIASRLFISPRTVEWHLSGIFAKLQITSRRQLHHQ